MAKGLRGMAVSRAVDAKDFERLAAEAEKHLSKFLRENPDRPEVADAMLAGAMFSVDRALYPLREAKALGDRLAEQKAKLLADARSLPGPGAAAVPRDDPEAANADRGPPAVAQAAGVADEASDPQAQAYRDAVAQRGRLVGSLLTAQFQAALLDYDIAQTYTDLKAPARTAALRSAAAGMDKLWQRLRADSQLNLNPIGLLAHMWHGKITEELGDLQTAADIYEEVMGAANRVDNPAFEPLFPQVQQFEYAILARQNPAKFVKEASEWLKEYAGRTKAFFVGVSIGGYTLLEFWRRYREHVAALVLANTRASAETPENRATRLGLADKVLREGSAGFIKEMLAKLLSPVTRSNRPDIVDAARRMMQQMSPQDIAGVQQGMADRPDSIPTLKTIDVPTLVLVGEDEDKGEAELMLHHIPGSRTHVIPRAGHYAALEQPDEFASLLRGFLDGLPRR